jgi:hypothetical protein
LMHSVGGCTAQPAPVSVSSPIMALTVVPRRLYCGHRVAGRRGKASGAAPAAPRIGWDLFGSHPIVGSPPPARLLNRLAEMLFAAQWLRPGLPGRGGIPGNRGTGKM